MLSRAISKSGENIFVRHQTIFTFALLVSTIAAFLNLVSAPISANVVDDVVIYVPVSCTMSYDLDEAHSATINPGQLMSDIGTTTFTVFCNDNAGYSIYAVGYSNREYGNTNLLPTQDSTNTNIATSLTTSGNTSAWAMKLIPITSAMAGTTQPYAPTIVNNYDDYNVVPASSTKVATFLSNTDFTIGSSLQSTYRVYISGMQPADVYNGKVKYTLVHPANEAPSEPQTTETGKICYYANASDAEGTMGCQDVSSSVVLLASNFNRTGYGFAGWSDAYDYASNPDAHFYGPNETITLNPADYQSPNSGLSLYAVWVKSEGSLQDINKVATLCGNGSGGLTAAPINGSANLSSVSALTDQRDNQTYAIAKLADGKCWMIENMRIEAEATRGETNESLSQAYAKSTDNGNFVGLANAENENFSETIAPNSMYCSSNTSIDPNYGATCRWWSADLINVGNVSDAASRIPRYNNINTASRAINPTSNNGNLYSYGNYYNIAATYASTSFYNQDEHAHMDNSICPKNWKMPSGGSDAFAPSSDFRDLGVTIVGVGPNDTWQTGRTRYYDVDGGNLGTSASKLFRSFPNNFIYSGGYNDKAASGRGSWGRYWSNTTDYGAAFRLGVNPDAIYPGTGGNNVTQGYTIRCIYSPN